MKTAEPTSQNTRKLLLHACCGPCSLEPTRLLSADGYDLTIYYANSNIEPAEEYEHRLSTIRTWSDGEGLPLVEGTYDQDAWEKTAGVIGDAAVAEAAGDVLGVDPNKRKARCRACYRLRFEEAARYAADHGYACLGTTLSVSPYQYTDVIREELERAARQAGVEPVFRDFRPNYPEATRRSRALGMYRQNFCGCRISDAEAAAERAARKEERRREKEAAAAAHADERAAEERAHQARRAERSAYDEKQRRKRAVLKQLREQAHAADGGGASAKTRSANDSSAAPCDSAPCEGASSRVDGSASRT